jgi:four helix bundle protein
VARDHRKLRAFKLADHLVVQVYKATQCLPPSERYGLMSQLRRAAVSIPTNIVEGAVRHSDRHYVRFLEIALGSACEVRYLLALCERLEFLGSHECEQLRARYSEVIENLAALIRRINNDLGQQWPGAGNA